MSQDHIQVPNLEGQTIKTVRPMTEEELKEEGWENEPQHYKDNCMVIITEEGNKIYPSQDGEGNSCGVLFGRYDGTGYYVEGEE